jgi:hypothetical protein
MFPHKNTAAFRRIYRESRANDFDAVTLRRAATKSARSKIIAFCGSGRVLSNPKISEIHHRLMQENSGAASLFCGEFSAETRIARNIVDIAGPRRGANLTSSRGHRRFISTRSVYKLIEDENA